MDSLARAVLILLAAYLVGAIPFGVLVARARGVDILRAGSGNIGATNVGRLLGRKFGILVFLLDFAKGALPAAAAGWTRLYPEWLPVAAGLSAFLGHLFPVYLRFRGGKGVATGAGVVAVLVPLPLAGGLLVWLVVVAAYRYVSLASLAAALVLCGVRVATTPEPFASDHRVLTLFCFVAAGLVFLRHHSNLSRLVRGTENRLPEGPVMHQLGKSLHVLAVGLWFGMAVFFTFFVALSLFHAFESLARLPDEERPLWFPTAPEFRIDPETRKEQGSRAAGFAVSPLFDWYFLIQGVCGLVAVITALGWSRTHAQDRVHGRRVLVLCLALGTVLVGWPLERHVSELRVVRNQADDALRKHLVEANRASAEGLESLKTAAQAKRDEFGRWHTVSLFLNFATIGLVTAAMVLTAWLPRTTCGGDQANQTSHPV